MVDKKYMEWSSINDPICHSKNSVAFPNKMKKIHIQRENGQMVAAKDFPLLLQSFSLWN